MGKTKGKNGKMKKMEKVEKWKKEKMQLHRRSALPRDVITDRPQATSVNLQFACTVNLRQNFHVAMPPTFLKHVASSERWSQG